MSSNKREFPRANYPCSITVWTTDGKQEVIFANSANISAGGIFVHLNQKILAGSRVEIKMEFLTSHPAFRCFARVLRCDAPPQDHKRGFYALAIEFETLSADQQAALKSIVDDLISSEKRQK